MNELLLIVSPGLIYIITHGVKKLQTISYSENSLLYIRLTVGILSFLTATGNAVLTGHSFDPASAQVLIDTAINFLGATGLHHLVSKSKEV